MKTAGYFHIIICSLLAAAFIACDKGAHENEYPLGSGEGAFIVGLQTGEVVHHLNIFIFGSDGTTVVRNDYTDPRVLASEHLPVKAGDYTVVAVANVTADGLPARTTVADLAEWLKAHAADHPDMLTACAQESVEAGEVKRLLLLPEEGTDGIALSTLRLLLTLPDGTLPGYPAVRTATADAPNLRLTAEVYKQGTETRVHRRVLLCEPQADGRYLAALSLLEGSYDLRLWADRTTDGTTADKYYNADDLSAVTVLTGNYVAGGQTDEKDAGYATAATEVTANTQDLALTLTRPFARYRLVATDVEGYGKLTEKEDYPPLENLAVRISYEGYFPTGFNVATGKPNDALTGISYTTTPVEAEGYTADKALQTGGDFVLTNGEESFVSATVEILDRTTGEIVSRTAGVKIPYRRGHLTTVTGHFLTAGKTTGGVQIDTEWDEEIVVEF